MSHEVSNSAICLDLLVAKSQCWNNLITALERLGKQHNFPLTKGMFDRLLKPINQIILLFEDIFFTNFSTYTKNLSVGGDILKLLKKMSVPFKCCNDFPLDFLQNLSLWFCIPHSLKFANHDFSSSKRNTKYMKVAHLWHVVYQLPPGLPYILQPCFLITQLILHCLG